MLQFNQKMCKGEMFHLPPLAFMVAQEGQVLIWNCCNCSAPDVAGQDEPALVLSLSALACAASVPLSTQPVTCLGMSAEAQCRPFKWAQGVWLKSWGPSTRRMVQKRGLRALGGHFLTDSCGGA